MLLEDIVERVQLQRRTSCRAQRGEAINVEAAYTASHCAALSSSINDVVTTCCEQLSFGSNWCAAMADSTSPVAAVQQPVPAEQRARAAWLACAEDSAVFTAGGFVVSSTLALALVSPARTLARGFVMGVGSGIGFGLAAAKCNDRFITLQTLK